MDYDKEFTNMFNEYYPFERYIIRNSQSISSHFDDIKLTEVFVKDFKSEAILNRNGSLAYWTEMNYGEDVYIKVIINGVEARLGYFDFDESVRETIQWIFHEDFGQYEWQSLYIDYEDSEGDSYDDLKEVLREQMRLIKEKYGECKVKERFSDGNTLRLIKEIEAENND